MCEKCKNYEPSVSIPLKGTPIRMVGDGRIHYSLGKVNESGSHFLARSVLISDGDNRDNYIPVKPVLYEVVEITPIKTVPPKGTIVEVWDTDTKPINPRLCRSFGTLDGFDRLEVFSVNSNKQLFDTTWKHWEIVRQ